MEKITKPMRKLGKRIILEGVKYIMINEAIKNAGKGIRAAVKTNRRIIDSGGYLEALRKGARGAEQTVRSGYDALEDTLTDDEGKFDRSKAMESLKEGGRASRLYSKRTIETMIKGMATGTESLGNVLRKNIPSDAELNGVYKDIGSAYEQGEKILLRGDYEACIAFENVARRNMPSGIKYRAQIIQDIRASASGNKDELLSFYDSKKDDEAIGKKKEIVKERLKHHR